MSTYGTHRVKHERSYLATLHKCSFLQRGSQEAEESFQFPKLNERHRIAFTSAAPTPLPVVSFTLPTRLKPYAHIIWVSLSVLRSFEVNEAFRRLDYGKMIITVCQHWEYSNVMIGTNNSAIPIRRVVSVPAGY